MNGNINTVFGNQRQAFPIELQLDRRYFHYSRLVFGYSEEYVT